jgi:hypothetical protein
MPQIDFPPEQKEPRSLHYVLLGLSLVCVVLVLIINNA